MTSCASYSSGPGWHLALEASGTPATVALSFGSRIIGEHQAPASSHPSDHLAPAIADLLHAAGITADQLTAVVVGLGPGSFTGLRVALATAKGLCLGGGIPLWGVSSLAIAAASAARRAAAADAQPGRYLIVDDARRGSAYLGAYDVDQQGAARPACEDQIVPLRDLGSRLAALIQPGDSPPVFVASPAGRELPWPPDIPPPAWAEDERRASTALLARWRQGWIPQAVDAAAPSYLRLPGAQPPTPWR